MSSNVPEEADGAAATYTQSFSATTYHSLSVSRRLTVTLDYANNAVVLQRPDRHSVRKKWFPFHSCAEPVLREHKRYRRRVVRVGFPTQGMRITHFERQGARGPVETDEKVSTGHKDKRGSTQQGVYSRDVVFQSADEASLFLQLLCLLRKPGGELLLRECELKFSKHDADEQGVLLVDVALEALVLSSSAEVALANAFLHEYSLVPFSRFFLVYARVKSHDLTRARGNAALSLPRHRSVSGNSVGGREDSGAALGSDSQLFRARLQLLSNEHICVFQHSATRLRADVAAACFGVFFLSQYRVHFEDHRAAGDGTCDVPLGSLAQVQVQGEQLLLHTKLGAVVTLVFEGASANWMDGLYEKVLAFAFPGDQTKVFAFKFYTPGPDAPSPEAPSPFPLYSADLDADAAPSSDSPSPLHPSPPSPDPPPELRASDLKTQTSLKVPLEASDAKSSLSPTPFPPSSSSTSACDDGWLLFDTRAEVKRIFTSDSRFRVSECNEEYGLCASYPALLVVPATISDEELAVSARYRSGQRLPVISYRSQTTGACLARCSQPLSGVSGKRCTGDEDLVRAIQDCNGLLPDGDESRTIHIVDARPYKAAVGNSMMGKGYETIANYGPDAKIHFLGIDNIHVVRGALASVIGHLNHKNSSVSSHDEFASLSVLKASTDDFHNSARVWLYYVRLIVTSSCQMAALLDCHGESVLCHCSDGWDRTSQLTSLAMLQMDPFYRTRKGFAVLVEKEWLSFGHKFAERMGHGSGDHKHGQRSPVFVQFVDCVYQLVRQMPHCFEFNETFLLAVVEHAYSCKYGTFLFDSQRERRVAELAHKTASLWTDLCGEVHRALFANPFFVPAEGLITPGLSACQFVFWERGLASLL